MSKKNISISIDEFAHRNAKTKGINISEVCEKAIRARSGDVIDADDDLKQCFRCGSKNDLFWLCPDELWICSKCNKDEVRRIIVGVIPS